MVMLDEGKQKAGDIAKDELNQSGSTNAAVNMAISGARGSMDNLTMMAGSIGQAKVRGKRLERGYNDRVLAHFKRGGRGALDRGFISNSFKRGLEPTEFSCYQYQVGNLLLILRSGQRNQVTCREG